MGGREEDGVTWREGLDDGKQKERRGGGQRGGMGGAGCWVKGVMGCGVGAGLRRVG